MFEDLKDRLAWRRAHKLVARRRVRPWDSPPSERRALIVMPGEERHARQAWQFVESLQLDPSRALVIVPTGEIAFAPMSFMGRVRTLDEQQMGRLGLPDTAFLQGAWQFEPEVALCLMTPFDLPAALVVGAAPAAFRIGFFDERAEAFFDLMVSAETGLEGGLAALGRALVKIQPPILAPSEAAVAPAARSVWT